MKTVMTWLYINREYRRLSHDVTMSATVAGAVLKRNGIAVQLNLYRPNERGESVVKQHNLFVKM
jgi:hypothetical protein